MEDQDAHGDEVPAESESMGINLYGLTFDDWCPGGCYGTTAAIRAASNPNTDVLRTILKYGDQDEPDEYGPNAINSLDLPGYVSALIQAIISQHPENVSTLLGAGANPNGLPLPMLSHNTAGFLRLGPHFADEQDYGMADLWVYNRTHLLKYIPVPQLSSLTRGEVEQCFECPTPSRFWSEVNFRTLCPVDNADSIPALVAAAEQPDITILRSLLDLPGTDTSFWTGNPQPLDIPNPATPSSLSLSSPLHAAIRGRNLPALSILLSRGFNPNILPLAAPTRCITPAMATIVDCDPWNTDAYRVLREHLLIDLTIRTPVYNVSLLHFAVARLNLPLLQAIAADVPLDSAGRTALGHSILHIACLPLDESWVQMHSRPVFTSCRKTRNLSELDVACEGIGDYLQARRELEDRRLWRKVPNVGPNKRIHPPRFSARPTREALQDCHRRQVDVVGYLLQNCPSLDLAAADVHGNTALHYLASHRDINSALLDLLWSHDAAEEAWRFMENRYGFTAADLFKSGFNVNENEEKEFWGVIDKWEREREKEKEIWEAKFRAASHALVQRAVDMIEPDS
ncbi:MAG: hypothetical protein Q9221_007583 [Calogaya cf. arnoldii]